MNPSPARSVLTSAKTNGAGAYEVPSLQVGTYQVQVAVSGSDVYAGGRFSKAGGSAANYVAKWNGSVWSAVGSGMDNYVSALAATGSNLYAGGGFTTAGAGWANLAASIATLGCTSFN